jgi:hypothetical protein
LIYQTKNMQNQHLVKRNYRDRYTDLPKGEFDLKEGEIVDLLPTKEVSTVTVVKENGTTVFIMGESFKSVLEKYK